MKKAPISFLLILCLILVLMLTAFFSTGNGANSCGRDLTWTYDPVTCTLTVSGSGPMRDYPHISHDARTHPWADFDQEIKTIIVEEGVTYLGECAFCTCASLTEVRLPDSLLVIGDNAFWKCPLLTDVTIPGNVTTINGNAFKLCVSLTDITFLGDAPTEVADTAFKNITAKVHYPAQNPSWNSDTMIGHGGILSYHSYQDPA